MRGTLTFLLLFIFLLNGIALGSRSTLRLLGRRIERVESFLSSLQEATIELTE